YSYLVYDDPFYVKEKYDKRFAIAGENLEINPQFKEIDLALKTRQTSIVEIESFEFYTESYVNELILINNSKIKKYRNVKFKVKSNNSIKFEFFNPSNKNYEFYIRIRSKPINNKVNIRLLKVRLGSGEEVYELDISNPKSDTVLSSFIDTYERNQSVKLTDSHVIIESNQGIENIYLQEGRIVFRRDRLHFQNMSHINLFNISEIEFKENTILDTMNFTNGFGTFALGSSHHQFTSLDKIEIIKSNKNGIFELKIDPIKKIFRASGNINSLKFNDEEKILPIYKVILRDTTFIAAIVGAIMGGLFTIFLSRKSQ
ncbi:MAG: hypothetical protein KAT05_09250, partial [Spirochaetes bacterium]|nr:hypothetical protein [Spirochaetota bacterium]